MRENAIGRHKQGAGLAFRHAVEYGFRFLFFQCVLPPLLLLFVSKRPKRAAHEPQWLCD